MTIKNHIYLSNFNYNLKFYMVILHLKLFLYLFKKIYYECLSLWLAKCLTRLSRLRPKNVECLFSVIKKPSKKPKIYFNWILISSMFRFLFWFAFLLLQCKWAKCVDNPHGSALRLLLAKITIPFILMNKKHKPIIYMM